MVSNVGKLPRTLHPIPVRVYRFRRVLVIHECLARGPSVRTSRGLLSLIGVVAGASGRDFVNTFGR